MCYPVRPYLGYGVDMRSHVRPCLGHGIGIECIVKLARESEYVGGTFTLSIGLFGYS
ncbi:Leucyl/phenylalanyl-tRNA--protein transferase [Gossypium arboreum]|uniref:Leucyl/phenylalanyl-tRNA--protein transferase n=1 Tax=Gossypium arboreum TaxID=29729 RepID=A0A0B0MUR1_GOSAR|nr:Leucyl/phenylalanyl-tRNA--protein transferase [Gossypium arboreum]